MIKFANMEPLTERESAALHRSQNEILRGYFDATVEGMVPPYRVLVSWARHFPQNSTENLDVFEAYSAHLEALATKGSDTEESRQKIGELFAACSIRDLSFFPTHRGGRWITLPVPGPDQTDGQFSRSFLLCCFLEWLHLVDPPSKSGRIRVSRCDMCEGIFVEESRAASARFCHVNCRTKWHRQNAAKSAREKAKSRRGAKRKARRLAR